MFNSTVLEVAIGLIFCFCAVSLIVSSINEAIASFLNLRGKYLLRAIQSLLNDPAQQGLVLALYNHARFNPAGHGMATRVRQIKRLPSYADPQQFALALAEILKNSGGAAGNLAVAIQGIPDPQLRLLLMNMHARAGADLTRFEAEVAHWFDHSMQRLAGRYKRTIQWCTVLIAFLLALAVNIDALHLFKVLWAHPALMKEVSSAPLTDAHSAIASLNVTSLPIGWEYAPFEYDKGMLRWTYTYNQLAQMAAGWAITASSALFGAPFWFDLLQRITNLRGTGPKVA